MKIVGNLRGQIARHFRESGTNECCGVVVGEEYIPLANVCENPQDGFELKKADHKKYIMSGKADMLVHSHTDGSCYPSEMDQQQQIAMGIPWVIMAQNFGTGQLDCFAWGGDLILKMPLDEREFRHGVLDCYAALRSWYFQDSGLVLPDYVRGFEWWTQEGQDLYIEAYIREGFRILDYPKEQPKFGDGFLKMLGATVYNHAGVYLGNNLAYHHRAHRLSSTTPIGHYLGKGLIFLRHKSYE